MTDSTSSLRPEEARSAGVTVVPLQVVVDGESRPESDGAGRRGGGGAAGRPDGHHLATQPGVLRGRVRRPGRPGASAVVSVHLSAAISGTCAAAERAATDAAVPVTVVDCRTLAMAAGFAVLSARGRGAVRVRRRRSWPRVAREPGRGKHHLLLRGHPGVPAARRPDRPGRGRARLRAVGEAAADRGRRADPPLRTGPDRVSRAGPAGGAVPVRSGRGSRAQRARRRRRAPPGQPGGGGAPGRPAAEPGRWVGRSSCARSAR